MIVYKFSSSATAEAPDISAERLINQMKDYSSYTFGTNNMLHHGVFKINGWAFNLQDELKKYVVKQYGDWHEYYAPNKTTLRKLLYGRIENIQEVQ
jgi:hypothetical protein